MIFFLPKHELIMNYIFFAVKNPYFIHILLKNSIF